MDYFINNVGITRKHLEHNFIRHPFLHTISKNGFQERIRILTSKISNKILESNTRRKCAWNREGFKQNKNLKSKKRKIEGSNNKKILPWCLNDRRHHKIKRWTETRRKYLWDTWVVQLVKRPTLDFGSGHDLTVVGPSLVSDSVCLLSLPLSLCPSPTHVCALSISLSQNKSISFKIL